jgi:HK97 family phage portal protein
MRATGSAISTAFAWTGARIAERLSLVPVYLSNLLWLINQTFRELTERGYRGNAAVYACLRLLCSSVPEPPLIAYLRRPDGEPGDPLPWNHALRQLIRNPNPLMTEYEFWEMVTLHTGIVGRSTWWKERDNAGRLIAHWPLRPDRVGPIYGSQADADASGDSADGVLVGWSYLVPGTSSYIPIPRRDVLVFNFPDPMGESGGIVEGLGPLQVLASEIGADNEATRYVGSLLANDARPGTVLEVQGTVTSQDDANLIKAAYTSEYGGKGRGKVGVVDKGTKVTSIGFNLTQLEFPALRRISESRIAAAFGTPAILVGLLVGLEAGIRATIAEQRELFVEQTLAVYWRRFGDQYTMDVASEFGANLLCAFDVSKVKALATQNAAKVTQLTVAAQLGAVTINELRDGLNLPPRDDGDVYIHGVAPGTGVEQNVPAAPEYGVDQPGDDLPASAKAVSPNGKVVDGTNTALVAAA